MTTPRTVEAERFVLVDDQGNPRITLEMLDNDSPSITVGDKNGETIVRLWEANGKPVLQFISNGILRASLAVAPDDATALIVGNEDASVTVGRIEDEPVITLKRNDGATRVITAADEPRRPKAG